MSSVDLAILTSHRRHELENRIHEFETKCDRAINDLKNMKLKAHGFIDQLNCDPSELKERFLGVMQKLDEYMYLATDFNLALGQLAESPYGDSPVQDLSVQNFPASLSPFNIMDVLTEPRPTTSHLCTNLCRQPEPVKVPVMGEQKLIIFSGSSSAESVPEEAETPLEKEKTVPEKTETVLELAENVRKEAESVLGKEETVQEEEEIESEQEETELEQEESVPEKTKGKFQTKIVQPVASSTIKEPKQPPQSTKRCTKEKENDRDCRITTPQPVLEAGYEYPAVIMNIDGPNLYVITEDLTEVTKFLADMTVYYENHPAVLSMDRITETSYCAFNDHGFYYRAMILNTPKISEKTISLYAVDTGEIRTVLLEHLRPLHKRFCSRPPYARFCHLEGVDLSVAKKSTAMMIQQEEFLKNYCNTQCILQVYDDDSESLGVHVMLPCGISLNDLLVDHNLAVPTEERRDHFQDFMHDLNKLPPILKGPPSDDEGSDPNIDIMECPEYDDPVVAVTGYHNRDEADICPHYKGPPEKTCFKGDKCTKKHVLHHPDGWTLDKVSVPGNCPSIPLPEPGSQVKVVITTVCHFDRVYVQLAAADEEEDIPEFGYVLPPKTLNALVRDMNSPATLQAYKRLKVSPAIGELVAAKYTDNYWYRARVRTVTRADQCVEVIYIDYGTVQWVKEDQVRELDERFLALPAQAIQCVLAGVVQNPDSRLWARAKLALTEMVLDKEMIAHVIAREFDELIVELVTCEYHNGVLCGVSIADRLAELGLVTIGDFSVAYDRNVTCRRLAG